MSKLDRRNQAKQRQLAKQKEHHSQTSIFTGRNAAPRIVAVLPLCASGNTREVVRRINDSVDLQTEFGEGSSIRVPINRFKGAIQYLPLDRDLTACLDAARVADFVVVVLSASEEVDELGELILRSVESQGLSTLFTVVEGLESVENHKQKQQVLASLKSYITHFHPEQDKLYTMDNRQDCLNLTRTLCNSTPKGVHWRDERSWMLVESVSQPATEEESTVLTGVVRGKGLNADRLVQVGDWGAFQIEKITAAPLPKDRRDGEGVEEQLPPDLLATPGDDLEEATELAPDDVVMYEEDEENDGAISVAASSKKGVLLDNHHYFSDEEAEVERQRMKKVPKGTSTYQSAWFLDDAASESGSDLEDLEMQDDEAVAQPEDGIEGYAPKEPTEAAPTEYPQSEMFIEPDDADDAEQLAQYRASKRGEVEDDKEFPDEIELLPNVSARERLARYRGLKSLRTSVWEEDEDRAFEPEEWRRLLQVYDYKGSRIRASREALVGGVPVGTRVQVHVKNVPKSTRDSYQVGKPLTMFSLLRHENKKTVVNYLVNLSSDCPDSIRSKEEMIVQCGPRRFTIKPQFSQPGTTPNDVHKYCRFLHPGQSAVASFIGPVTWGSVPVLFFKRASPDATEESEPSNPGLTLVATGTAIAPSTSRVIAKRVILTGHPYHIHKKVVTIRYMFFNRDDVEWFKALPLWTKRGRSGYIREALGTHGYFKANFDGRINPQDAIGVSLYKRVWPRDAVPLAGPLPGVASAQTTAATQGDDLTMDETIA